MSAIKDTRLCQFWISLAVLLSVVSICFLDAYSENWRRTFENVDDHDEFSKREPGHNQLVDDTNLYEAGIVGRVDVSFLTRQLMRKYAKLPFSCWKLAKREAHPRINEMNNRKLFPKKEQVITFIINGNKGSYEQFPIIGNSLEHVTNHLTLQ
jgi:hypothetical protein